MKRKVFSTVVMKLLLLSSFLLNRRIFLPLVVISKACLMKLELSLGRDFGIKQLVLTD